MVVDILCSGRLIWVFIGIGFDQKLDPLNLSPPPKCRGSRDPKILRIGKARSAYRSVYEESNC